MFGVKNQNKGLLSAWQKNNDKVSLNIEEIENLNINTAIIFSKTVFEVTKDNLLNFARDEEIETIAIHQLSL